MDNTTKQCKMASGEPDRKPPSVWDRFVSWCIENSLQSRLDLFGGFLALVVVLVTLCNVGNLDEIVKHPLYIIFAAAIPLVQFFSSYLTGRANDLYVKTAKELSLCHDKISKLEPLNRNLEDNFGVWLLYILKVMRFGNDSRASFYLYDDRGGSDDRFIIVARESMDPKLKWKGRREFPWNQGVIGTAWKRNQESFFCRAKITDADYDAIMVNNWNFDSESARRLTMRSHTIMGHVILNFENRKVGVVIVESQSSVKKKDQDRIEKNLANIIRDVSPYLSQLFSIYADILLNQESPKEE